MNELGPTTMVHDPALAAVRMLAVDIDGTLLTSDHRVLPAVREAFARGRSAGLALVLASARSPGALRHIMEDLDHGGPCVCFSGAWSGHVGADQASTSVLSETTIAHEAALRIAEAAILAGLVPSWHTERRWTVPKLSPSVEREMRVTRQEPAVTPDFADAGAPNKILLIGPRDLLTSLRDRLVREVGDAFEAVFSHETYLEVLPKGIDKAKAVLSLASRRGLEGANVAAVGDAQNDLGMIRAAGYGMAMGNAIDAVRQAARWITSTNDEAGVARCIDRILDARQH